MIWYALVMVGVCFLMSTIHILPCNAHRHTLISYGILALVSGAELMDDENIFMVPRLEIR